jgi:Fe-S oxidoreductase
VEVGKISRKKVKIVNNKSRPVIEEQCTHCHKCQEHCSFLSKYKIDIGDTEALKELAYHCFLCGKCTQVCPIGIDGKEIILNLRRESVKEDNEVNVRKTYKRTIAEKLDYSYRNYRHVTKKSVLFPGCNFPSLYPKTTEILAELLETEAGIGIVYDCCGKPISDLGMADEEQKILRKIENRLVDEGVTEIITLCPNCYYYLKNNISIKVENIYKKLKELGIGEKIAGGGRMFVPCPDRIENEMLCDLNFFLEEESSVITEVQCCGLGGQGGTLEAELSKGFSKKLKDSGGVIYTYCGSCVGKLSRNGCRQIRHVLPEILGTGEKPDTVKSLLNRKKTKYL